MGIKLFVDDWRDPPDETWHIARTNTAAVRLLAQGIVDEISLDYDIAWPGPGEGAVAVEETFEPIALYIARIHPELRPKVRFHTANVTGGVRMAGIMEMEYDDWPEGRGEIGKQVAR